MKNFKKKYIGKFKTTLGIIVFLLVISIPCQAQYGGCVDTTTILYGSVCDTNNVMMGYAPVCGCDGNSYFNQCVAQSLHGVQSWQDGVCQNTGIGFVLWPNPVNYGELNMILGVFDLNDNVHITIYNADTYQFCYENYYMLANYTSSYYYQLPYIDVSLFPRGVYLIIAQSSLGSQHVVQKFVVQPLR